jgi:hypothetical protein
MVQDKAEKAKSLIPTVRAESNGCYSVESSDGSGWRYLCRPKTATTFATCDCQDQRRHREQEPTYRCKHLESVRMSLQLERAVAKKAKEAAAQKTQEESTKAKKPAPLSMKKSLSTMEERIKAAAEAQNLARIRMNAEDLYQETRARIQAGEGDAFTVAACHAAWLDSIDDKDDEELPEGIAFLEA